MFASLEAAIRQHQAKLDAEFPKAVAARHKKVIEELILPRYNEERRLYEKIIKGRKGVFTNKIFTFIPSCLHPDSRNSVTEQRLSRAFQAFKDAGINLCNEQEMPVLSGEPMPRTYADLMKHKAKVKAERAAKRAQRNNEVTPRRTV